METLEKILWEKFDKKYLKISIEREEFNLLRSGEDIFSIMEDTRFYIFDGLELDIVIFRKNLKQNLAYSIAQIYYNSNLSLLNPEQLIYVSNNKITEKTNNNVTFNAHIYNLTSNQIKQIDNEYQKLIANKYN